MFKRIKDKYDETIDKAMDMSDSDMFVDEPEDDETILRNLGEEVKKFIDIKLEDLDRSYFNFKFSVDLLGTNFTPLKRLTLIDDVSENTARCEFCNENTLYYDNQYNIHVCATHFAQLMKAGGGSPMQIIKYNDMAKLVNDLSEKIELLSQKVDDLSSK